MFWANKHVAGGKTGSSDRKRLCLVWAVDWLMCAGSLIFFCVSSQTVPAMQITRTQDISLHKKYSVTRLRVMKETSIVHYWNWALALLLSAPPQRVRRLLSVYPLRCFYVFDVRVCVCVTVATLTEECTHPCFFFFFLRKTNCCCNKNMWTQTLLMCAGRTVAWQPLAFFIDIFVYLIFYHSLNVCIALSTWAFAASQRCHKNAFNY